MTVYFARAVASGQIKIGMVHDDTAFQPSLAVRKRLRQVEAAFGVKVELLATAPGGRSEERAYHERHLEASRGSEWFDPSALLLAEIATLQPPPSPQDLYAIIVKDGAGKSPPSLLNPFLLAVAEFTYGRALLSLRAAGVDDATAETAAAVYVRGLCPEWRPEAEPETNVSRYRCHVVRSVAA